MDYDFLHALLRSSMALFIILDPVGLLPVVIAVTVNQEPAERQRVLYLSALVAFALTLLLTFTAKAVFSLYGMQIADFQIAGGVVLFLVAYRPGLEHQTAASIQGISLLQSVIPALFHLALALCLRGCRLNNPMMTRISTELRQRHAQLA